MTQSSEMKKYSTLPKNFCRETTKKHNDNHKYDVRKAKASLIDAVPLTKNPINPYSKRMW